MYVRTENVGKVFTSEVEYHTPIATFTNSDDPRDLLHIVMLGDGYALYVDDETSKYYKATTTWPAEIIRELQMLPLPYQFTDKNTGNVTITKPDELPGLWVVSSIGNHQFKCLEFYNPGTVLESRKATGRSMVVDSIAGARHQYYVRESEQFPNLINKRIAFDPVTDKMHVV